jgi:hypothetical protein
MNVFHKKPRRFQNQKSEESPNNSAEQRDEKVRLSDPTGVLWQITDNRKS